MFSVDVSIVHIQITKEEIDNWYRIFGPGNNFDYNMMPGPVCRLCEVVANGEPCDTIVPEQLLIPIKGISPEKTLMLEIKGNTILDIKGKYIDLVVNFTLPSILHNYAVSLETWTYELNFCTSLYCIKFFHLRLENILLLSSSLRQVV